MPACRLLVIVLIKSVCQPYLSLTMLVLLLRCRQAHPEWALQELLVIVVSTLCAYNTAQRLNTAPACQNPAARASSGQHQTCSALSCHGDYSG